MAGTMIGHDEKETGSRAGRSLLSQKVVRKKAGLRRARLKVLAT